MFAAGHLHRHSHPSALLTDTDGRLKPAPMSADKHETLGHRQNGQARSAPVRQRHDALRYPTPQPPACRPKEWPQHRDRCDPSGEAFQGVGGVGGRSVTRGGRPIQWPHRAPLAPASQPRKRISEAVWARHAGVRCPQTPGVAQPLCQTPRRGHRSGRGRPPGQTNPVRGAPPRTAGGTAPPPAAGEAAGGA